MGQMVVNRRARAGEPMKVEGYLGTDPNKIAVRTSKGTGPCHWAQAADLRCLPDEHQWVGHGLIDTCRVCGEERA